MTVFTLRNAELAFGHVPLLDGAQLVLRQGERVGLVGRNGAGKSTLLKLIARQVALDDGEAQWRAGLRIAYVEQEPQLVPAANARASMLAGVLAARGVPTEGALDADELNALRARIESLAHALQLDGARSLAQASGGERKRAALVCALAQEPQLLLLDEPTNHLDIPGIERLEELLELAPTALIITHDRQFLDRVTTRIVELDRGLLRSYAGNFAYYAERRAAELAAESAERRRFDQFWAQEEVWIRQGVEARRTRNEGRVRRLEQLRRARAERRERLGRLQLSLDEGMRSGRLVAELQHVSKRWGELPLIEDLSLRLMRGDRLGLIGPNGAGKSTLIRLLLGELAPDSGSVRLGTALSSAYFDQLRAQLDPERSVAETISPGSDWVEIGGRRKHVMSYLADFLFAPQRAQSPVRMLSGGERQRLLLARLFARPTNLLVLDEPTNDLDIDSLELLEQTLQDYTGTLIVVSHDRRFLDAVVTQTLVAEGAGRWREYVGGYSDWLRQRPAPARQVAAPSPATGPAARAAAQAPLPPSATTRRRGRLGYKEGRELEALPAQIEALEQEQAQLIARMSTPDYHRTPPEALRRERARLDELAGLLAASFARWEQLEAQRAGTQDAPGS
ncbi:MAG TPA: ATP-binding cassette domain-containing protein [Steroidobacteraceae bacterium]|nr:ATP-binding cassette domain-containing protein [Steroidobacteraceae bacterium]